MRNAGQPIRKLEDGNPRLKGGEMNLTGQPQAFIVEVKRIP
jgi:hypothetical protein